jgi:hypothetical protein
MGMGLHQSPRDARGTAEQFEADSPRFQEDELSQAKYAKKVEAELAGRKPSIIERFKRWFSARF